MRSFTVRRVSSDTGVAEAPTRGARFRGALLIVALAALVWAVVYSASFKGWVLGVGAYLLLAALTLGVAKRTFRPSLSSAMKRPISYRWAAGLAAGGIVSIVTMVPVWYWEYRHDRELARARHILCAIPPPPGAKVLHCDRTLGSYRVSSNAIPPAGSGDCKFEVWIRLEGRGTERHIEVYYSAAVIDEYRRYRPGTPPFRFSGWTSEGFDAEGVYSTYAYFVGSVLSGLDPRC